MPVYKDPHHWISIHVDFVKKEILCYDSMGAKGTKYLDLMYKYLEHAWNEHHFDEHESFNSDESWCMRSLGVSIPQQNPKGVDCAVFMCMYAIYVTDPVIMSYIEETEDTTIDGLPLCFDQKNMKYMRRRLALDMLNGVLE